MPSPDSSNWYDRFLYYLEQALTAAGGIAPTVVNPETASWYARVEASMMLLAQTLAEGSPGGGAGNIDLSNPGPIGSGTASSATFTQVSLDEGTAKLINFLAQLSKPSAVAGQATVFADSSSRFAILSPGGFSAAFNFAGLTSDRVYAFPNQSGTFATTNDLQNATFIGFGESGFPPAAPTQGVRLFSYIQSRLAWRSPDGFIRQIGGVLTNDRTYNLPDKPGTFAMTSDIPVTDGATFFGLARSGSAPVAPAQGVRIFSNSQDQLGWRSADTYVRQIVGTLTASRDYELPDKSGVFAMLSDIPSLDSDIIAIAQLGGSGVLQKNPNGTWEFVDPGSLGGGGGIGYYEYLNSLSPALILKLADNNTDALDISNTDRGDYSGTYTQGQSSIIPSLPSDPSVQFNDGGIFVATQFNNPNPFTFVCRFSAAGTASGSLLGFGNFNGIGSSLNDRQVYLADGNIRLRVFDGSVQLVTASGDYLDGLPHTLCVRCGGGLSTIINIDGVTVATGSVLTPFNYNGFWKIAHSDFAGFANGISMQGVALYSTALSEMQMQLIHAAAIG